MFVCRFVRVYFMSLNISFLFVCMSVCACVLYEPERIMSVCTRLSCKFV